MEVISHWHPNITINIVDDHTPWVKGSVPPPLDQCELPAPLDPSCFLVSRAHLLVRADCISTTPKLPTCPLALPFLSSPSCTSW